MRVAALGAGLAILGCGNVAAAATWTNGTTPHLGQIFAIDATGEANWLYGAEDVLGDGLSTFTPAEQALDLRTAYASTNQTQLWTRVYVSGAAAVDTTLTVFVFVDSDMSTATGGGTASTTLSPMFTTEMSPGGYDYVIGVHGDGTMAGVWQWRTTPTPDYVTVATNPAQTAAEAGSDTDPIRIGAGVHAYVQSRVDLSVVGLTQACDANLWVRSARASGASDLDMTYATSCVPAKTNGVPTILVVTGCTSDAQCPQNGVCDNGQCVLAPPCGSSADCPAGDTCTADGRCVPTGGGSCTTLADCPNGLACVSGSCVACTQGGNDCGAGYRCAPNGTCVAGGGTGTGEVEGGAFHCSVSNGPRSTLVLAGLASLLGLFYVRRRRG
jgi:MYXO-CTERM domain-containing protein